MYSTIIAILLVVTFTVRADGNATQFHVADSLYVGKQYREADSAMTVLLDSLAVLADTSRAKLQYRRAVCRSQLGLQDEAERDMLQAVEMYTTALGEDAKAVGSAWAGLGLIQNRQDRPDAAAKSYERALRVKQLHTAQDSLSLTSALNGIAELYQIQGKHDTAAALFRRVLAIRLAEQGPEHPDVGKSMVRLGDELRMGGFWTASMPLLDSGLDLLEASPDGYVSELAEGYNAKANLLREMGDLEKAETLFRRAEELWESIDSPFSIEATQNRGVARLEQGDFLGALLLIERALRMSIDDSGDSSSMTANIHDVLGCLYIGMGRHAEAEQQLARAVGVWRSLGSDYGLSEARSLNNLGHLFASNGDQQNAEKCLRESLDILQKSSSPSLLDVSTAQESLSLLYLEQGRCQDADSLMETATSSLKAAGMEHSPLMAYLLVTKADAAICLGDYDGAADDLDRALSIYAETYGEDHPEVVRLWSSRSRLLAAVGEIGGALDAGYQAFELQEDQFAGTAIGMSERDALLFANNIKRTADQYLFHATSTAGRSVDPENLLRVVSAAKGAVSDIITARRQLIGHSNDTAVAAQVANYRTTSLALAREWQRSQSSDSQRRAVLDSLQNEMRREERGLAMYGLGLGDLSEIRRPDIAAMQAAMPHGAVAVEYYRFKGVDPVDNSDSARFLAMLVPATGAVRVFDLGDAVTIRDMVQEYSDHLNKLALGTHLPKSADLQQYTSIATRLYNTLLGPFEDLLSDCELLLIAPDAELNLVSFAGLVGPDGRYLAERLQTHYLGSLRDVLTKDAGSGSTGRMLALGNPDFDADVAARSGASEYVRSPHYASDPQTGMNLRSGCGDLATMTVRSLPNTLSEIDRTAEVWRSGGDSAITILTGAAASEDSLKSSAPGCEVLHLATHGYFLEGRCASAGDVTRTSGETVFAGENPLLLSGLLLAGANLHGEGADSAGLDDGVLTALEVSAMDLDNTRLVVLSACETGLGRIQAGEGVYGLRRAFQIAGADAVVSSLWPVPDKQSGEQLADLYSGGGTLPERLRQAQMAQLQQLREMGLPDHPFVWAGFVSFGDWRQ